MPDVFISYSREDQAIARRFAEGFERAGLSVWWDQALSSGDAYDEVTEKALRQARAVVVLWSRTSVSSRWVRAEATLADRNRTLVPVMIELCERPIMFELTQTADLAGWNGDTGDSRWKAFAGELSRFTSGRAPAVAHAAPLPVAGMQARDALDGRPSLAILPFANRSGDASDDAFADGMEEDLLAALSLSQGLRVIARSATIGYRNRPIDPRTVGRELGTRYLLEGNVRRVGANLRVTAQLVQAEDAGIIWVQRFDRPLLELAALQEQLVVEVAAHLNVQLQRAEAERALKKPGDLSVWEALARARATLISTFGLMPGTAAVEEARRAVDIAPGFALAHATLAATLGQLFIGTGARNTDLIEEARMHAERALRLAPDDPQVLASCAIPLGYGGDWNACRVYAQRAVDLNPNETYAHSALAMGFLHINDPDRALEHLQLAGQLAPRGGTANVIAALKGLAHFHKGDVGQALVCTDEALLLNPGFTLVLKDRAAYLSRLGRRADAIGALRRLRAEHPNMTLEDIQRANRSSFMSTRTAEELNGSLADLWQEAGQSG